MNKNLKRELRLVRRAMIIMWCVHALLRAENYFLRISNKAIETLILHYQNVIINLLEINPSPKYGELFRKSENLRMGRDGAV